jgi:hypothetical protein
MKFNLSNPKGNGNIIFQDSNNQNKNNQSSSKGTFWGIVIGLLGVLVAVIVGWNEILSFLNSILK